MDLKLAGKTALVTGSTAGIGYAIALGLAREGARVIVNGRTQARVDAALATIRQAVPDATVEGIAEDLGTAAGCERLVRGLPTVDILVNNLGIFEPKPFAEIPDADWLRMFEVNVMSGVRLSRAYLPGMKRHNWGRIVFISSESAVQIPAEMSSLRHDQDGADRSRTRHRGKLRRNRSDCEQRTGRPDGIGGRDHLCNPTREAAAHDTGRF
jgi:NAD(P)-dependent dehydrogenase (short-subunit alcohol dehydrogenase family)